MTQVNQNKTLNVQQLIHRIGETDQMFLQQNTPTLALERANLRLQLIVESHLRQEQIHFLQEAIVLLEQARLEFEEMPLQLYFDLSITLAKAYMLYFEFNKEAWFALITQQILKPLSHHQHAEVYFYLAYAAVVKNEQAMTRYWLSKYLDSTELDLNLLYEHHAFIAVRQHPWFVEAIKLKAH